jgi:hypothetical protein
MSNQKKDPQFQSGQHSKKELKGLYGVDPDESLLSVQFATTENPYLNEHYAEQSEDQD